MSTDSVSLRMAPSLWLQSRSDRYLTSLKGLLRRETCSVAISMKSYSIFLIQMRSSLQQLRWYWRIISLIPRAGGPDQISRGMIGPTPREREFSIPLSNQPETMAKIKHRLELNWIGKETRPRLEPRILLEDPSKSYHAKQRVTDHDIFDNRLIFGDNLLALKALEQEFAGKVKCVFIDPPYNTGSAFTHYDDGVEHSIWLSLMRDRLELIRRLLSEDGSLWITIDDNEAHYLKVLCDEIFGRSNYIASAIWQKTMSVKNSTRHFSVDHDYVMVYAANAEVWIPNPVPGSAC